jgi:hypothetical protein
MIWILYECFGSFWIIRLSFSSFARSLFYGQNCGSFVYFFRGQGVVENFLKYSDFKTYEDSSDVAQKEENETEKKTGNKTINWKLDIQRARNFPA